MAKKTKKVEEVTDFEDLFAQIAKGVGGEVLDDRDSCPWGYIDTGILALNYALSGKFVGGGVPSGYCLEIFGGSSSGKTLIGTNLLRGTQTADGIATMLDAEQTLSKDFAVRASRVDPKKFIITSSDTLEKCFNRVHRIIRNVRDEAKVPVARPLTILYDSIAVSPSEREFAETTLDMETASQAEIKAAGAGADKPGERAKICSKELRKIPPILLERNVTLAIINQTRQKIGVMYGPSITTAGGGTALEFYCTHRLQMSGSKHIKDKNGRVIGINVNIRVVKNKHFRPFQEVRSLRLFFDKGIDPFGGLLEVMLQAERVVPVTPAGTYQVVEPFAGGKEIRFRSTKERNDIPWQVLTECPALVDAETPDQVKYYLDMFGDAVDAVENDIGVEEDMSVEED